MRGRSALVSVTAAIVAVSLAAAAVGAAPPRIGTLNYFVRDDGQLPHTRLLVDVHHARTVRVATFFDGQRASSPLFVDDRISGHPWVLKHQGNGDAVYKLIRRSLARRDVAAVRVRARNDAGRDRDKLRIRKSDCTKDPPFYPLDCTVHP